MNEKVSSKIVNTCAHKIKVNKKKFNRHGASNQQNDDDEHQLRQTNDAVSHKYSKQIWKIAFKLLQHCSQGMYMESSRYKSHIVHSWRRTKQNHTDIKID